MCAADIHVPAAFYRAVYVAHLLPPKARIRLQSKNANWKAGAISFFRLAEGKILPSVDFCSRENLQRVHFQLLADINVILSV